MVLYTVGIVSLLKQINYWNTSLLKDTILWIVFSGVVLLFRFTTTKDHEYQFRRLVFDNLKLVIVLEFIMNTYTFSLVGEIIFIPILSMIVMVSTYSNYHEEYESVAKITDWFLAFVGFAVLAYAMTKAFSDLKNFGDLDTIRSFLLPIILAFSFIPFFYLIQVYTL